MGRKSRDMFGFIDLLAWRCGTEVYAIQFTSLSNHTARVKKIQGHSNLQRVRGLGWHILVWSWKIKGSEPVLREEVI